METHYPSPFPDGVFIWYWPDFFLCEAFFRSNYLSMNNWVPDPKSPPHTDPPPAFSGKIWHKCPLFESRLTMLSSPVSTWYDSYQNASSYVLDPYHYYNSDFNGILPLSWDPTDTLPPPPKPTPKSNLSDISHDTCVKPRNEDVTPSVSICMMIPGCGPDICCFFEINTSW